MPQVDVFHGQLAPNVAKVYVRVNDLRGGGDWTIAGRVRGPECRYAKTLQIDAPLKDLGAGPTLLGCATVTDPCLWSPELPSIYRVEIQLRSGGKTTESLERQIAFRGLGADGCRFYWAGKRWVIRGVAREVTESCPLSDWRDASTTMVVESPEDELCGEASREGVLLVALVADHETDVGGELQRLAQWPSVAIAVAPANANLTDAARAAVPNLLLGVRASGRVDFDLPPWASVLFVDSDAILAGQFGSQSDREAVGRPLIAVLRQSHRMSIIDARAACDTLQRSLAPLGDFAGYIVSSRTAQR